MVAARYREMRWLVLGAALLLSACGRIGFDPSGSDDSPNAAIDGGAGGDGQGATGDGQGAAGDVLPFQPILRFRFEGSLVEDISGTTPTCDGGCPTFTPGRTSTAALFNGSPCLVLPDSPAY